MVAHSATHLQSQGFGWHKTYVRETIPCSPSRKEPEMTNTTDISTKEGWAAYLDQTCNLLKEIAVDDDLEVSECRLILTANPETGEALAQPGIYSIITRFDGDSDEEVEEKKDQYAVTLKLISLAGCGIGSIFMTEAWMSNQPGDGSNNMRPSEDPDRKEALILLVQHKEFGSEMRAAYIDHVDGKRQIRDWSMMPTPDVSGGRFGGLVPNDEISSNKKAVAIARAMAELLGAAGCVKPIDDFIRDLKEQAE